MTTYFIENDIKVFGTRVADFPDGIKDTFRDLRNGLPDGKNRSYYGISEMDGTGQMIYYAMVEEVVPGEAALYNDKSRTITHGTYLAVRIHDWKTKTGTIMEVFAKMLHDKRCDKRSPAVEWYRNDEEMLCLIRSTEN